MFACQNDESGANPLPVLSDAGARCPRTVDSAGPDVSFETDLLPLFSITCAFGGCHDGWTRQAGLYLGPNFLDGPADAAARAEVIASLLAQSTTAPVMRRVVPYDPTQSFVMVKVTGCQNGMGLECGGVRDKPCGDRMPGLSDELPEEKQRLLARWIAQGAKESSGDGGLSRRDGSAEGSASGP